MQRPLPPLSTLRAFEAVARLGSVSRAAEELGRTHGAVSKQLRTLADHTRLMLFDKVGTGLRPNAAGMQLATAVSEALEVLSAGYAQVVREARSPGVQVACSATFAMRWLVPHMAEFTRRYPDIGVRLSMTSAQGMRDERDADLIVLWDWRSYPTEDQARAIPLGAASFGVVAAPDYPVTTDGRGRLSAPCRVVHEHTTRAWDDWETRSSVRLLAAETRSFPHSHLCIEAAVAGLGVTIAEHRLIARELDSGRLVQLGPFTPIHGGFVAIPHGRRPMSMQTRRFVDWLAAEMQSEPVLGGHGPGPARPL